MWGFLKTFNNPTGGFMFSNSPELDRIGSKMESLPNSPGHSGSSFAFTMRHLEYIAKNGMSEYKKLMNANNN
jgi:hypothetical protein